MFTGREFDAETGLFYYRTRYFSADLGRFLARDPAEADANLYRYCRDNPIALVDPLGLCACQIKIWIGDTLDSHKALENWLKKNIKKDAGGKDCPQPLIGVIGCGTYGPGGDNGGDDTLSKLPPIPKDQRIPGFPQIPGILQADDMFGTIEQALKAARDAAKQLCESGKCDSVSVTVDYTSAISKFLRTGEAPYGDGPIAGYDKQKFNDLLKQLNKLHSHPEKIDCEKCKK